MTNAQSICADCNTALPPRQPNCQCGWQNASQAHSHAQCIYAEQGQRCPHVGTISPDTHATTRWYCHTHYHRRRRLKNARPHYLLYAKPNGDKR